MPLSARIVVTAFVLVLALPAPALAASSASNPGNGSAIDVYNQAPQTSTGKLRPGAKKRTEPLSAQSKKNLASVDKKKQGVLKKLATQSNLGAPVAAELAVPKGATNLDSSAGRSLLASIISPSSGSGGRLLVLLLAMISIPVLFGVAAVRKQRALHPHDPVRH
jgi:hypothetical protein